MLHSLFGTISTFKASRRIARILVGGLSSARILAAAMLVVVGACNSVCAASSDDVDRMLGVVSAQAVKLRQCYMRRLDLERAMSCEPRNEIIEAAKRSCAAEEFDLRKAVIESATREQRASIASLTGGVLDAVRRPVEDTISDASGEVRFYCLVKPMSR